MDPFTITASVIKITSSCVSAAKTLNDIRQAWKRCPVTVSSLCSQLRLAGASLSQVQSLVLGDVDILKNKPDVLETFDTTLTSCMVITTMLEALMHRITKEILNGNRMAWIERFKTVWNENTVKELLQQLHGQQKGITVLVSLLQMNSMSEMHKMLRRHEELLRQIAANTQALRKTHSIEAPNSIFDAQDVGPRASIIDQLADAETENKDFGFDSAIMESQVYKKTFNGILVPVSADDASADTTSDAETITDADMSPTQRKEYQLRQEEEKLRAIEIKVQREIDAKRKELLAREGQLREIEQRMMRENEKSRIDQSMSRPAYTPPPQEALKEKRRGNFKFYRS